MKARRVVTIAVVVLFVATVVLANWLVQRFGVVPVGFGLSAPAAVYAVGLALTLRDLVHDLGGRLAVLTSVAVGSALSFAVAAPPLALASGLAFLTSETIDTFVYGPLRRRGLNVAVLGSNAVGVVVDSLVFLAVAFGSLAFLPGQIVGKVFMTLVALFALSLLEPWRRRIAG